MYLARVTGEVVATKAVEGLFGHKLLLIDTLDANFKPRTQQIALDTVQAGVGDLVTCVGSREAALAVNPPTLPIDAAIVGIVDQI